MEKVFDLIGKKGFFVLKSMKNCRVIQSADIMTAINSDPAVRLIYLYTTYVGRLGCRVRKSG